MNIIDPPIAAFPDIPTPPHTTKAPLPLNKVSVVELIKRFEVNVFAPAIVWARVVIRPVEPAPAIGRRNS